MTTPTTLDGLLVQWGDRLFYPGNRTVRSPPAVLRGARLHDRALPSSPRSPRATKRPER